MSRFDLYGAEETELFKKKIRANRTNESTNFAVKILNEFWEEQSIALDFSELSPQALNDLLCKFYMGVRNKKGEYYKLNSMRSIRFSLQRYFLESSRIDIILNSEFVEANTVFENVLKVVKASGKGETNHHPEVEPEDLQKLFDNYDISDPTGLQELVWFNTMFYFIRRGRENMRAMNKNSFSVGTDASGEEFIYQVQGELDKNHGTNDNSFDTIGEGRIYANNGPKCPVLCFKKYISKLNPNLNALWQRPREKVNQNDGIWYCNVPHGEKHLGGMLSRMSLKYKLSQRYTNHSLRVTSLQTLDDAKIEGRHIIRVSGHKSTSSVQNYARKLSTHRKRSISAVLSERVENTGQQQLNQKNSSTSTNVYNGWNIASEISDDALGNISANMLTGNSKIPIPFFAPVLHKCSNIQFHINIEK